MSNEDTNVRNPIISVIEDKFRDFMQKNVDITKIYSSGSTKNNKQLLLENSLNLNNGV